MKNEIYVIFSIVLLMISCSKDEDVNTSPVILDTDKDGLVDSEDDCPNIAGLATLNGCPEEEEEEEDVWTVNRANQYTLNIVFFKPTDFTADETLINEVSTMMLYIQKWYEKQMELQGFGKKTFGLITNQTGKVRVHLINGAQASSSYSGHSGIVNEIDQYFSNNPGFKTAGAHTFVLGSRDSGVPFYGINKMAFATSENFELTSSGKFIEDLELKNSHLLGGIMHELGHGLNLPHNCHKASDLPNIALMSFGNHTYQTNPDLVFLTKATCAILDVNQSFNTTDKLFYSESPKIVVKSYSITKDDNKKVTIMQGLITADVKLSHFWIGHDGMPAGGGDNYDNITWTKSLVPTANANEYSFEVEMAYSDIFNGYKAKDVLRLEMVVLTENGIKNRVVDFEYTVNQTTQVPNDDILKVYTEHIYSDRSNWIITANSFAGNNVQFNMIDGLNSTYWHSKWPWSIANNGNHIVTIDMGVVKDVNGIYLLSFREGGQFRPKHVIVSTSNDNATWTESKTFTIASYSDAREVALHFDNSINTRYLKITVDQVYISNGVEENLILSEVDIF